MPGPSGRGAPSDPALVGRVVKPHGIAGEVVIELLASATSSCETGDELWIAGRWRRVARSRRDNRGRAVAALGGIVDRDAAEGLRDAEVVIDAADLPALDGGNFYVHDLVGCRVRDVAGNEWGKVVAVVNGPQDLLEIEHRGGRSLLPMARELLREVNVEEGRIVIDAPLELLDATRG